MGENKVPGVKSWEAAMEKVRRYRALGSLCRQQAAYNPDQSWHLLGQAERWEYLADEELALYFNACNATNALANSVTTQTATDTRWTTIAAA
jgi:hypothetical protein